MIFYFSGTGNSLFAARKTAETQGEQLVSIAGELDRNCTVLEYGFSGNDLLGFVFPVYAWGPPEIVLDFISKIKISGKPYIFSISTCGDDEGYATRILEKALGKKGLSVDSAFTVIMPNNYIIGFDVDDKEAETDKLQKAMARLDSINSVISERRKGVFEIIPGKFPGIKSYIINPLFNRFSRSTEGFYATDECTRCRICEKVCPVHTIKVNEKPVWGKSCTQCLACIHRCPVSAIQYGVKTVNKGRYVHPDLDSSVHHRAEKNV